MIEERVARAGRAPGRVRPRGGAGEGALVAAAQAGDEDAFAELVERYRAELEVHCYRMLGSFEDAEDVLQEVFLRAWTKRRSYLGRSTFRAWLYGIATNACLDALRRRPRRVLSPQVGPPADPHGEPLPPADLPWLQPYPDRLLDAVAEAGDGPGEAAVARETIELAFLAAIQHLPPRQRAVLILRDVLEWSAAETATLVDASVAAVNSALQRARATLGRTLPRQRLDWAAGVDAAAGERLLLDRFMDAWERGDVTALAELLREDARLSMPPSPTWYEGRDAIVAFFSRFAFAAGAAPHALVPTRANRQPAFGVYVRRRGERAFRPFAVCVLRIEGGLVADMDVFRLPELFRAFGLAPSR